MHAPLSPETQRDRLERLEGLNAERGPDWPRDFKPGSFGCHELLDRAALVAKLADESLLSHPACVRDPEWFALAWQAVEALNELYRRVGAVHLSDELSDAPT